MFSNSITGSDAFTDMPLSAQALYFHLGMEADDDGFVNNPKRIQKTIGAAEDDMKLLFMKKFVIPFDTGICVIKHWNLNNYIRKDRYHPTVYQLEKSLLKERENKVYTLINKDFLRSDHVVDTTRYTSGIPCGIPRVEESSVDKSRIEESREEVTKAFSSPSESLFELFESEFARTISSVEIDILDQWQNEFPYDVIKLALEEAVKNNARSFRYIEVILANWKTKGVRNLEDAKRISNHRKQNNSFNKGNASWEGYEIL